MSNLPRSLTFLLVSAICLLASGFALAAPPVASDDAVSTQLNTSTLINVLGNDTPDPGAPLVSNSVNVKRPFRRGIVAQRDGQVRFTPKTGFIGDEVFTYTVRDSLGFISNVATVTVTVNGAPTDIALSAATLSENQPAGFVIGLLTTTDPNAADTHTYSLAAGAGDDDNGSFLINGNALESGAVFDFETKSSYSVRIRSTDSGSGNLFFEKAFTISVTNANDAPVFTAGPNLSVNEDAGAQVVNAWATGIDDGDSTLLQSLTFNIVSNSNSSLFSVQPAIGPTGDLSYTPAPNANGAATISVQLTDSGSNTAPDVNQSTIQTFTISVNAVNDAPSFAKGSDVTVSEDSGPQSISGWATAINDGDPETDQTLVFSVVGNTNPALFSVAPSVNPATGGLTFTPANNANGSAAITLALSDNGGTANGGIDTAPTQLFIINVTPVNDPPVASAQSYSAHTNIGVRFSGLLTGAIDPDSTDSGFTPVIQLNSVTPCSGCTVTVVDASTGTVDFIPPPGATGNVSFTYTVIDNGNPGSATSSPATVTVNIAGPVIWFVDDSASAGGNGTLNRPFQTLAAAANVDNINETIFLYSGNYSNGYVLLTGEKLVGQGATGTTFDSLLGITPPEDARHDSTDRPVINGARPVVQDTIMLASSSLVRGLDIAAGTNAGLTDTSGATTSVNVSETAVSSASNTAVSFNDLSGTVNLTNTNSTGGVNNVSLTAISGTVSLGGGSLTNASGTSFLVSGGSGTISYSGSVTKTNAQRIVDIQTMSGGGVTLSGNLSCTTCLGINLSGNTGGTHTFSGTSKAISTGTNAGVTMASNNGATVNFSGGGLTVTTTSGTGFNATGGATGINVTGSGNTLSSTTGTALNVANTTIGASGLTFQSISSNAATNGIVLNNTGTTNGGLTVSGAGTAGSGGTIQNSTGTGILLTSTRNVVLNRMNVTGNSDDGIGGTNVNGFVLDSCSITGNGNTINADSGVDMVNLTGTASGGTNPTRIVNSTISNSFLFEIGITNTNAGTLTNLEMSGNTLSSNGLQPSHGNLMTLQALGNDTINLNVTSGAFTGNTDTSGGRIITATGLMCDHSGTGGTMTCNISGANFTNNNVGPQSSIAVAGNAVFNFNGNNIQGSRSHAVNFFADANSPFTKTITGRPQNNIIGTANITGSGSTVGFPIRVQNEGRVPVTMAITGNTINESVGFTGINVNHGVTTIAGANSTNMTITGNSVNNIDSGRGVLVQQVDLTTANQNAGTVCSDIRSNTFSSIVGQGGDGTIIRIRESSNTNVGPHNVNQLSPTASANANELDDANGVTVAQISLSGTPTFGTGTCTQPTN